MKAETIARLKKLLVDPGCGENPMGEEFAPCKVCRAWFAWQRKKTLATLLAFRDVVEAQIAGLEGSGDKAAPKKAAVKKAAVKKKRR